MKKTAVLILFAVLFSTAFVFAEAPEKRVEGSFSYVNVPVLKVMEQRDNYVVYYRKFGTKIGCISIPREWFRQGQANRKGFVKPLAKNVEPYLTLFFEEGEFVRLNLNVPNNKMDKVWGVFAGVNVPSEIDPVALAHGN